MQQRTRFRELMRRPGPLVVLGVYDCLSAMIAERAGYDAVIITGAGIAASVKGYPDFGLMTMPEVLAQSQSIIRSITIPAIADCDTGYGNAINVRRTAQEFEAAGAACVFIEDQVAPWRCGQFDGKQVISASEMEMKIKAFLDVRQDPDFALMARTDALATHGFDAAMERCERYVAAGAELLMVSAPRDKAEMVRIMDRLGPLDVPVLINMVEGAKTPLFSVQELGSIGFKIISFSGSLQRAAIKSMQDFAAHFKDTGSVDGFYPERMVSNVVRSEILKLDEYYDLEQRYAATEDAPNGAVSASPVSH
jgi:2,3-dimethylmalate lyase